VLTRRVRELDDQRVVEAREPLEILLREQHRDVVGHDGAAHAERASGVHLAHDAPADLDRLQAATERLAERALDEPLEPALEALESHRNDGNGVSPILLRTALVRCCAYARVAELADAQDSGSCARKGVGVQVPPRALRMHVNDAPDTSFLAGLGADDTAAVFAAGTRRTFASGEMLCREGDPVGVIVLLLSGYVKLTKTATSGRETMLELRGPGEVLGEMSVVDRQPQSANAIALEDVEALAVDASRFDGLRRERAGIANALLSVVVRRLRQASGRQLELGTDDVISRVCRRLAELAASHGERHADGVLVSALSQQDLADWAGVSRDGVVRALHELREAGLVESGRGRVLIKDLPAVTARAGGA
jgi:CRP/FNR family transcriptional regulator, cyclic AMP receptor protein